MTQDAFQEVLHRLVTAEQFRDAVQGDPRVLIESYDLEPFELITLLMVGQAATGKLVSKDPDEARLFCCCCCFAAPERS